MFVRSWWRRIFNPLPRTPIRRNKPRRSPWRIEVELLENRLMPANIFVHNFADGAVAALTPLGGGNFTAPNLRSAVSHHNDFAGASTIFLDNTTNAATTYKLTNAFGGELDIFYTTANALTIKNGSGGISTIDGQHNGGGETVKFRIFEVEQSGKTTFDHLRIIRGDAPSPTFFPSQGGGIRNDYGGDLTLLFCQVSNNTATGYGSGSTSQKGAGGGIFNDATAKLTIQSSTVDHNTATGGSVSNRFTTAAGAEGGGLCIGLNFGNGPSTVTITASTFAFNKAVGGNSTGAEGRGGSALGGGLEAAAQSSGSEVKLTIINSTFANNTARGGNAYGGIPGGLAGSAFGGAMATKNNDTVQLVNDTIALNQVIAGSARFQGSAYGGGIDNLAGIFAPPTHAVSLLNTIVAKNTAQSSPSATAVSNDVKGTFNDQGHNLIGNADGSIGFTMPTTLKGTTLAPFDPGFDPAGLANNGGPTQTIALLKTSKAIDAADDSALSVTGPYDQRGPGFARKSGKHVDIGAYEFQFRSRGRDLLAALLGF